jgi:biotin carboxylase
MNLEGKKVMLLDGAAHSIVFLQRAKELGVKTLVANIYSADKAPAKKYADEAVEINFSDEQAMRKMMIERGVDGILQGTTDSHLTHVADLAKMMGFPCYGTREQFELLSNKETMKKICREHGVPVSKEYQIEDINGELPDIEYPVITKPVDGSGSRGFSICNNADELRTAYLKAKSFSQSGRVLIEQCMDYRSSVIINYLLVDGDISFCGMSDKLSKKVTEDGAPTMAFQYYKSIHEDEYVCKLNDRVIAMLKDIGLKNGVIWVESFYQNGEFIFNEFGYRFGGSMTYLPIEYFYGVKELDLQIEYALTGQNNSYTKPVDLKKEKTYCLFPVHVKPGKIVEIKGMDQIKSKEGFMAFIPGHLKGVQIQNWGSTQQVFGYFHFVADKREEAEDYARSILC